MQWIPMALALASTDVSSETTLLTGATLLPMTGGVPALEDHALAFRAGVITWIGPAETAPPADVVVDVSGSFVLPGLIDAHVHLFDDRQLALYLVHGVTTVFNLSGTPLVTEWRAEIAAGARLGPRIYTSGPQVKDAAMPAVDSEVLVPFARDAGQFVRRYREAGFDFLKIWSSLDPAAYESLLAECRAQDLPVTGHVPSRIGLRGAIAAGQDSITHVEEVLNKFLLRNLDRAGFDGLRAVIDEGDLSVITTLITYEMIADTMTDERLDARMARPENRWIDPALLGLWGSEQNDWRKLRGTQRATDGYYDDAFPFLVEIAGELHRAGVPLLAGSDAGLVLANVLPGSALHRELELLGQAGLSPLEALACATTNPGVFLDPVSGLGTLVVGAPADVLVLREDPRTAIDRTRAIEAVVASGVLHDRRALDAMRADVATRVDVARDFLAAVSTSGFDDAAQAARAAHERREPVAGEATLLVSAYQRASAGDVDAAIRFTELASDLYPDSYRCAYFLAGLLEMRGSPADARLELLRARELCPEHPWIPARLAWLTRPATPEELIELAREAERSGRYADVLPLVQPRDRDSLLWAMWFDAAYRAIGKNPRIVADYERIVAKHGLDEAWLSEDGTAPGALERIARESLRRVVPEELYHDLATFRLAHGRFAEAFGFLRERGDVTIDGDRATAPFGASDFQFVRQEGVWYWDVFPD